MATNKTFLKWLKEQRYRDDPVSDLADDVVRDKRQKPRNTKKAWSEFLASARACSPALEALDQAWEEYVADVL